MNSKETLASKTGSNSALTSKASIPNRPTSTIETTEKSKTGASSSKHLVSVNKTSSDKSVVTETNSKAMSTTMTDEKITDSSSSPASPKPSDQNETSRPTSTTAPKNPQTDDTNEGASKDSDSKPQTAAKKDPEAQKTKLIEVKPASEPSKDQKKEGQTESEIKSKSVPASSDNAKSENAPASTSTSPSTKTDDNKKAEPNKPAAKPGDKQALPNLKVAKKWGTAVDKAKPVATSTKKRRSSKVEEIDPFLAKYAVVKSRRATITRDKKPDDTKASDAADDDEYDDEDIGCCERECCSWAYWRDYVIDPADPSWFYWSLVCASATFYNMVVVFLRAVFTEFNNPAWYTGWFCFDYLSDFITILDMMVRCRLGFLEQGILVVDKMRLVKMYIKSFRFPIDIISILPFDLVYMVVGVNTLLRLNRLLRVWRVQEFYHDSETRTTFPNMFRMIFLIINICLMIHWNACIYYSLSKYLGFGNGSWQYDDTREGFDDLIMRYIYCFYWSMLTLTAIGDTDPPETITATTYCIIVTLCGVLIFATIFGNVGAMINQMNASRQEFQQNVDAVKRYMDIRKVSPVLQDRVIQWFAYTWNNKQSVDDKQALNILPEKLRAEIAIQVHLDTLKRVAIFKDCEPGLLQELVLKLRLQVFSPGDYICRKGDIGKEMYIIKRGKLEVVSPDGKIVFVTMQDGAVFGEVSILNIAGNKTGNRRTASVRSVGYSDLFCLSKDDLWDALKEYPEARMMLWEKGKQILRKDNLLDEEAARKKELADMSLETKVANINEHLEKMSKQLIELSENLVTVQKHMGILPKEPVAEDPKDTKK